MSEVAATANKIIANIEKVIIGKRPQLVLSLVTYLCEGHLLLEDVPGVAKTMLARALARSIGCTCVRNLRTWLVRVVTRRRLREFWEQHADAESRLRAWYQVVSTADWRSWDDLKRVFPSADLVAGLLCSTLAAITTA